MNSSAKNVDFTHIPSAVHRSITALTSLLRRSAPWMLALTLGIPASQVTAQAFTPDRPEVTSFINEVSQRNNINPAELRALLERADEIPRVIDYIKPPTQKGIRSWQRYRPRFIDRVRINGGVAFWKQNQAAIERAEQQYGVPAEVIVAIIGVETIYGRNTGNFNTFSALSTLAFDYPPRAELFRKELESLILLARDQQRDPFYYSGSYAGAIGLPQFLPSSVRNFAVDFDGDGHIDLLNSPTDAIGSVANFLVQHGWKKGEPITLRARVQPDADVESLVAADITPQFSISQLAEHGVTAADGSAPDLPAAVIDLVSPGQPTEYWLGYQNFYTITRYNRSSFYAMSVAQLAEAVRQAYTVDAAKELTRRARNRK